MQQRMGIVVPKDMLQVAKFLDAGVKRMQEIDPDAGSNI